MAVRRKLVREAAVELLGRFGVEHPPVPLKQIARRLGARVVEAPSDDESLSGFLLREHGQPEVVIGVNRNHRPVRQRFTIAHELGHFLLHRTEGFHVDRGGFLVHRRDPESAQGTNPTEIEANMFAAELLMPAAFLARDVRQRSSVDLADEDSLRDLARRYEVSPQAMAFRLANLGYLKL